MISTLLLLTTHDVCRAWACCTKATPYQRGFEDVGYDHIYANPYPIGGAKWQAYERGAQDARAMREGRERG